MADADTGSTPETTDRIEIYADYVCPFCYLGTRSLEQYREGRDEPLTVEWHPFDLRHGKRNPDGSIDQEVDDGIHGFDEFDFTADRRTRTRVRAWLARELQGEAEEGEDEGEEEELLPEDVFDAAHGWRPPADWKEGADHAYDPHLDDIEFDGVYS